MVLLTSFISTCSYLILIPFFLRIVMRYHRIALGHPLFFTILELTNPIVYPIARIVPPSMYYDRAAIIVTWICVFIINQMKLFFHPHPPFLEVLTILSCLDWLNRLIILYLSFAVLRGIQGFLQIARPLELIVEQIVDPSIMTMLSFMRMLPNTFQNILRKYPLACWIIMLFCMHLYLEEMMIQRLAW